MEAYAQIRELAAQDRLGHAWLLLGQDPGETEKLALYAAKALLCSGKTDRPCGRCPHCRKLEKGIHPDLLRLERMADKREITVDQIRELRQEAWVAPNEAGRKVFLLPEADTMNISAQNALLKVLEEPPASAAFLLMGKNPGAFLPTIRSRCLTLRAVPAGEAAAAGEDAAKLAEAFLRADPLAWARAAFPCEKLDREKFDALVDALEAEAALRARSLEGDGRALALALHRLVFRLREMRKVNVSPGHCLGWLGSLIGEGPETLRRMGDGEK